MKYVRVETADSPLPTISAFHQIEQREQENPDDVHEVPVQAGDFDGRVAGVKWPRRAIGSARS